MYALRLVGSDVCCCAGRRRARLRGLRDRLRGGVNLDRYVDVDQNVHNNNSATHLHESHLVVVFDWLQNFLARRFNLSESPLELRDSSAMRHHRRKSPGR